MPLVIENNSAAIGSLGEVMDYYASIDIGDRDAIAAGAPVLAALANNRTFLAERVAQELHDLVDLQANNQYSSQVFFLGRGREFFVRANFWPSLHDTMIRSSGPGAFFYGIPHDHNFDFLTVGYYGPGYISDFYEYDFDEVVGYPGERLNLRFVCRDALSEGRMILYRRSLDIHEQLAPDSFSISLNVVADQPKAIATINQYMIDLDNRSVRSLGNRTSLPLICEIASYIGDEECVELLDHLAQRHPYPRGRMAAIRALARRREDLADAIWARACADASRHVSEQAKLYQQLREQQA